MSWIQYTIIIFVKLKNEQILALFNKKISKTKIMRTPNIIKTLIKTPKSYNTEKSFKMGQITKMFQSHHLN